MISFEGVDLDSPRQVKSVATCDGEPPDMQTMAVPVGKGDNGVNMAVG